MAEEREGSQEGVTPQDNEALLPAGGVKELADRLTEYMTRIELADMPDAVGQVLDDFLMQTGGIPEEMDAPDALDQVVNNQLAVTLAFQLGRLAGRAPQLVEQFTRDAFEKWGTVHLDDEKEITVEEFNQLAERVLPKLRRWRYYLDSGYGENQELSGEP